MSPEILIDRPTDWLGDHDFVEVEGEGQFEILTANRHGDLQIGSPDNCWEVNISNDGVTVLENE
jgi:hypothetical protein